VIEQKVRLGGHTETYTDPGTGQHVELGVEVIHNTDLVKNYFARFSVPMIFVNASSIAPRGNLSVISAPELPIW